MNSPTPRPKKSPASKARRNGTPIAKSACSQNINAPNRSSTLRQESHAWLHTELPTQLERDTSLTPEWVAETVVQEVERFLNASLPAGFAERLAAKAHHLYPRHRHFHKMLNRPGNRGRDNLYVYMRHWTAGWLKRERSALYKKLPWSFGQGWPLPVLPLPPRPASGGIPRH
jgi:hypothetical protein